LIKRDYDLEASKEIEDMPHLTFAEWITEMNPNRKKKSKAGSSPTPWRLFIGIFRGPFLIVPSSCLFLLR